MRETDLILLQKKIVRKMHKMIRKLKQILFAFVTLSWLWMPNSTFSFGESSDSIWSVMADNFSIHVDTSNDDIRHQLHVFLHNPQLLEELTENARPYLYHIFQEVQKKHMPAELALLPMIESNYKPGTRSSAGAVGLWQLTSHTASNYGISMNSWYDGRKNAISSTKVALSFLSYLHQTFNNNWLLAIAAYDAGPATVMNAIRHNQRHHLPTDFWSLSLPRETQLYIPKLLALADIIQRPDYYHLKLSSIPNSPVTNTVTIQKQTTLTTIAHDAKTSVATVKKLNPAFRKAITPPHQTVTVLLPAKNAETFKNHADKKENSANHPIDENKTLYTVKSGDSLSSIAHHFHLSIKELKTTNQLHSNLLHLHQSLIIPIINNDSTNQQDDSIKNAKKITSVIPKAKNTSNYIVKSGDSLQTIAAHYKTTPRHLMQINHLKTIILQIHQHLKII